MKMGIVEEQKRKIKQLESESDDLLEELDSLALAIIEEIPEKVTKEAQRRIDYQIERHPEILESMDNDAIQSFKTDLKNICDNIGINLQKEITVIDEFDHRKKGQPKSDENPYSWYDDRVMKGVIGKVIDKVLSPLNNFLRTSPIYTKGQFYDFQATSYISRHNNKLATDYQEKWEKHHSTLNKITAANHHLKSANAKSRWDSVGTD